MSVYCPNADCPDLLHLGTRGKYREGVVECPRCGAALVEGVPEEERPRPAAGLDELVCLSSFATLTEAVVAQSLLESNGISACVSSGGSGALNPMPGVALEVDLLVDRRDLDQAEAVLSSDSGGLLDLEAEAARQAQTGRQGQNLTGFRCPKCGSEECDIGELRAAGGFWSKVFDVQSRRFTTVTCCRCRYTELYQGDSSTLGNIFDFFTE